MATGTIQLALDTENRQIMARLLDSAGAEVSTWGSVKIVLGADPGTVPASPGTNMGKEIKLRETQGCDPDTGDPMYCIMLRSAWYSTALTSDPET